MSTLCKYIRLGTWQKSICIFLIYAAVKKFLYSFNGCNLCKWVFGDHHNRSLRVNLITIPLAANEANEKLIVVIK